MNIYPNKAENPVEVPREAVGNALPECDETKLKVLLAVLAEPSFDEDELCERLDVTKKSFAAALSFWEERGVWKKGTAAKKSTAAKAKKDGNVTVLNKALTRASELPHYTADEIADYIESNADMEDLLMGCQQTIGKIFNKAEVEVVVGLKDYLKLDDDYIMLLFSHCVKMGKKSLRYIEKLAVGFFDDGILAYDELDEHLTSIEEAFRLEHKFRSLFGIGRRALTKKEKDAFERWVGKWKMPFGLVERAYEITVENTGGASVPYCSAILEKWYACGYTTVEEVDAAIAEYRIDRDGAKDKKGSFETDDFFEAALRRSYGDK